MTTDQRLAELNKKMDSILYMLAGRSERQPIGDLAELKRTQKEKCSRLYKEQIAAGLVPGRKRRAV